MNNLRKNTNQFPSVNSTVFNSNINTEQMFEFAIEQANLGKNKKAMEIARESLISAKQNNLYVAIYIHAFMAALCLDKKDSGTARIHVYNALNRLNKNHFNYNIDKNYLTALLNLIEKQELSLKQKNFAA